METLYSFYLAWAKTFSAHAYPGFSNDPYFIPKIEGKDFPVFCSASELKTIPASNPRIQMHAMIKEYDPWHNIPRFNQAHV
jgi:hypothetical protein